MAWASFSMKETYYFPHDSNSIQDPKMIILLNECGLFGVGAFWVIIEILHQQQRGCIGLAEFKASLSFYGKQGAWDENILSKCEKILFDTGLLVISKDNMVFSERVKNNLKRRAELSNIGKENALKRWDAKPMPTHRQPNTDPMLIKERKEKKITTSTPNGVHVDKSVDNFKDQKQETDIQLVVKGWKLLNNIPTEGDDSKSWDKVYFPRYAKSVKSLLSLFGYEDAVQCMEFVFDHMKKSKLSCTIETVVKHADLYREKLSGRNK